jgi:hypothetical protein
MPNYATLHHRSAKKRKMQKKNLTMTEDEAAFAENEDEDIVSELPGPGSYINCFKNSAFY